MRSIQYTLAASALALAGITGFANAQDCAEGQTCEIQPIENPQMGSAGPAQPGALTGQFPITRFNTQGGTRTLLNVRITSKATISYDAQLENLFVNGQTVTVQGMPGVSIEDNVSVAGLPHHEIDLDPGTPGNALALSASIAELESFPGYDGVTDFAGPSGRVVSDSIEVTRVVNLTDSMDLDRFIQGSGSGPGGAVIFDYTTVGAVPDCAAGTSDFACIVNTLASVEITVEYIFCACEETPECECINRREPGSFLLFPEYNNGPGHVTVFTVTNANCNFVSGEVDVELRYINGESCQEANQKIDLTPCDTYTWLTSAHSGYDKGYAYAYARVSTPSAVNPAGTPIVFNHLIGNSLVVNGWKSLEYSINAVSFKAFGDEGDSTDKENPGPVAGVIGDGVRDFDGFEYEEAPDKIYIPRFLGQDDVLSRNGLHSDLILVNLSGGRQFATSPQNLGGGTTILIHGWNDNEQMFSLEHTFSCWQKLRLGLLQSGDLETPLPGTFAFDNDTLDNFGNDPSEIAGANGLESGWFWIDGLFADSTVESIMDPAVYAVLVETVRGKSASDLPFEYCSQPNGDLLPNNLLGDFNRLSSPGFFNGDNQ